MGQETLCPNLNCMLIFEFFVIVYKIKKYTYT